MTRYQLSRMGEQAVRCPIHEDAHASASLNLDKQVLCCMACGFGGGPTQLVMARKGSLVLPLNAEFKTSLESALVAYEGDREQVMLYLQARGIDLDTVVRMRLGHVSAPASAGHEQIYRSPRHSVSRPRLDAVCAAFPLHRGPRLQGGWSRKYLGMGGQETRLFNIRAIHEAGDTICITEGEIDAVTLSSVVVTLSA